MTDAEIVRAGLDPNNLAARAAVDRLESQASLVGELREALENMVKHAGICDERHYPGMAFEDCLYVHRAQTALASLPKEADHEG